MCDTYARGVVERLRRHRFKFLRITHQSLQPQGQRHPHPVTPMFAPITEIKGVKRQSDESGGKTEQDSVDETNPNGRLQSLMCRLLLQHEAARQSAARCDDVTMALKKGAELEVALE